MDPDSDCYTRAIKAIDEANSQDPDRTNFNGQEYPSELIYSMRLSAWLAELDPDAPEALSLAVRCQHLRRWAIPRSNYPTTRAGYHQWRTTLGRFHADEAAAILRRAGYDEQFIARVQSLIRKERFKSDPQAQTLEDVACLAFLELDYVAFARRHETPKVIDIIVKTWRKMSDRGHQAAIKLAESLPQAERELIATALNSSGGSGT